MILRATRMRVLVLVLAIAGTGGAAAYVWQQVTTRRAIAAVSATLPDTRGRSRELVAAIEDAARRAQSGPDRTEALAELSSLYHANGYLAEAVRCYVVLQQLQPGEGRWAYRHAVIVSGFGQAEAAMNLFEHVLRSEPDYLQARLRKAELHLKQGELNEARSLFEKVLNEQDNEPYALLGLARCSMEERDWPAARGYLERVVKITDFALGYDLIVTVYERMGLHAQAEELRGRAKFFGGFRDMADPWMESLWQDSFDAFQLSLAAGAAKTRGELDTARALLERAVRFSPKDAELRFQLAIVLMESGQNTAAREQLVLCTQLQPSFADPWAHLTGLVSAQGDHEGAQRILLQGLASAPESPGLNQMRARELKRLGRLEEAVPLFQKAIRLRPTDADAYIDLALTYFAQQRENEALEQLRRALVAEPSHPVALTSLAFAAIQRRDEQQAAQWLGQAQNQPRIQAKELARLVSLFRQMIGRDPN